jgi:membrane protein DedA with SNARE-associated domain/membrane-associated phospholipid phosphatase
MRPAWLAGAAALTLYGLVRRKAHGRVTLALLAAAALAALLVGTGLVPLPDVEGLIEDAGQTLGTWTYALVGALSFLETGAFVGLVVPGETTVIVGGLVAGQGEIDLLLLIAVVWFCAVAGDLTSYVLGRRLGRGFLLRHGGRVKITEERLGQVEGFLDRHGGATILVGRFIGVVRSLAPFVAGASRMPVRRFLPYDILGAGLWATTFCVLGYVFWRSFDQLTNWVSRGVAGLGVLVALGFAVWFALRLARDGALRRRVGRRVAAELDRSALRPVAPRLRAAGRRADALLERYGAPRARAMRRWLSHPGIALELATLVALAGVGGFTFAVLADELEERPLLPLDAASLELAQRLYTRAGEVVALGITALGSFPAVAVAVLATAAWAAARRRRAEAGTLVAGFLLTWLAVRIGKAVMDRPRPEAALYEAAGMAYPSGHAAQAVAWIACAVVLLRGGHRLAARFAVVAAAVVLAVAIAVTRVYLRVHYLSDVVGGLALGTGIFAAVGIVAVVVTFVRQNAAST